MSYETFWLLNPNTLQVVADAYRTRMEREAELKSSNIDIAAWSVGLYVRAAILSAFDKSAPYPTRPISIQRRTEEQMTAKDHAAQFRNFLRHYKRPPVKGGEK